VNCFDEIPRRRDLDLVECTKRGSNHLCHREPLERSLERSSVPADSPHFYTETVKTTHEIAIDSPHDSPYNSVFPRV
jgi:hypothetical protein